MRFASTSSACVCVLAAALASSLAAVVAPGSGSVLDDDASSPPDPDRAGTASTTPGDDRLFGGLELRPGREEVRVQVRVDFYASPIVIGVCSDVSCTSVGVTGLKGGVLGYALWRVFVNSANPWAGDSAMVQKHEGPWLFTKGETIIFRVSLRDGKLKVAVEGMDHAVAVVEPQADEKDLKIVSEAGSAVLLGEGQATDGHAMAVGDTVAVQFCATSPGLLLAGLCGAKSCAFVAVYGLNKAGGLRYGTALARQENQLTGHSEWVVTPESTNSTFRPGQQMALSVRRYSETEMQVWLRDDDQHRVSVSLDSERGERAVLKALGRGGNVLLHRRMGREPFLCPGPPTQVPTTTPAATPRPSTPRPSTPRPSTPSSRPTAKPSGGGGGRAKFTLWLAALPAVYLAASARR